MLKDYDLNKIVEPLLQWFSNNARVLPWRDDNRPYRVWVSEIMLQQTRVEAVKPYFERFMKELPDVADLATCPQDKLLKLWEGLGYYNRVRNMQEAAQTVVEQYGGVLPSDPDKLLELKGIGSYTAGAIASIAYQVPIAAVDGNVLRVITRVSADTNDITKQAFKTQMEHLLGEVIPKDTPGAFNQALMELGAMVCIPNGAPLCDRCPWNTICEARKQNLISQIPVKAKKKPRTIEDLTVMVIKDNDRIILNKRPEHGLLAGLYELPNLPGHLSEQEVLEYVRKKNLIPIRILEVENAKHIFTHKEWHMKGYVINVASEEEHPEFVGRDEVNRLYSIPSAFSSYMKYMTKKPMEP